MFEEQAQYLHERVGDDETETTAPSPSHVQSQLRRHLAGLETWLDTIQDRLDEVRRASQGEEIESIADGGPPDQMVAAGRLLEALQNRKLTCAGFFINQRKPMSMDERAKRGRQFAENHDMSPEEALGFLLDKASIEGDSPASGEVESCAQAMTVGELKRRLISTDVPDEAKVKISLDRTGRDPFSGVKIVYGGARHYPVSDVSFVMAPRKPVLNDDGDLQHQEPEHRFSEVAIHCHEDVTEVDLEGGAEYPEWFREYVFSADHIPLKE